MDVAIDLAADLASSGGVFSIEGDGCFFASFSDGTKSCSREMTVPRSRCASDADACVVSEDDVCSCFPLEL